MLKKFQKHNLPLLSKKKKKEGKSLSKNTKESINRNIQFTRLLFEQARNLGNVALKFNMLYGPVQFDKILYLTSIFYDLYEIRYAYTIGKARNNIPIMTFIDGYCKVMYSVYLYISWSEPEFDPSPILTSLKIAICQGLKIHGETELNMALLQTFYNVIVGGYSYFINPSSVTTGNKPLPLLPIVSTKKYSPMTISTSPPR